LVILMPNPIPTSARELIYQRDRGRCVRCGARGSALHHRRRRAISDEHTHCACNLVTLCNSCHPDVHSHPSVSKPTGFIVSAWKWPGREKVSTFLYGWAQPTCDGMWLLMSKCEGCDKIAVLEGGRCRECLIAEMCCTSELQAARSDCGCGAAAARWLDRLNERVGDA